jgi:hypothetical protein
VRLAADKEVLLAKLHELDLENETLHRMGVDREEEAKQWMDTYYKFRR